MLFYRIGMGDPRDNGQTVTVDCVLDVCNDRNVLLPSVLCCSFVAMNGCLCNHWDFLVFFIQNYLCDIMTNGEMNIKKKHGTLWSRFHRELTLFHFISIDVLKLNIVPYLIF